jgi:hypothetical protein
MISYTEVVTESSLRASISVGLRQLAKAIEREETSALNSGVMPPVESACQQVSFWLKNQATTYDGRQINLSWFRHLLADEMDNLRYLIGEQAFWAGNYAEAGRLFNELASFTIVKS